MSYTYFELENFNLPNIIIKYLLGKCQISKKWTILTLDIINFVNFECPKSQPQLKTLVLSTLL